MEYQFLESGEFYRRRYHNFSSLLILPLSLLLLFLVGFLVLAHKEISLTSQATLEPIRIIETIQSPSSKQIVTNHLKDDQVVKKGDLLLAYDLADLEIEKEGLDADLSRLKEQKSQLSLLKSSLELGRSQFAVADDFGYEALYQDFVHQSETLTSQTDQANSRIAAANEKSAQTQAQLGSVLSQTSQKLADYRELREAIRTGSPLASSHALYSQYQAYKEAPSTAAVLAEIDSQIAQLESSESSYQIQYAGAGPQEALSGSLGSQLASLKSQTLTKVGTEMTSLDQQIRGLEGKVKLSQSLLEKGEVKAPAAGVLHLNPEVAGSDLIAEGTVLAQIYPDLSQEKKAKLVSYVSSKDIAAVEKGLTLRYTVLDAKKKSWSFESKVSRVADTPTKTKQGNLYKIEADLNLSLEEARVLKYGQEGKVVLITGEKSYLSYYWDRFLYVK